MANLEPEVSYVAANVRKHRAKLALTQAELAERAGVSVRALSEVETGIVDLSVSMLSKLARALGVGPAVLLKRAELEKRGRGRPKVAKKKILRQRR